MPRLCSGAEGRPSFLSESLRSQGAFDVSAEIIALPPVDPALRAVGDRLRKLRLARGVSEGALAAEMGVDRELLLRAERGRARLTSSQLYAATLALRLPMRLLFEPEPDLTAVRRL